MPDQPKSLWHRLFPPPPDFMRLLGHQLDFSIQAMEALEQWLANPSDAAVERVHELERQADEQRLELTRALSSAFDTPLDREDIDDLSKRLDDIVDSVRNIIREAAALKVEPDQSLREMAAQLQEGMTLLQRAIGSLPKDLKGAMDYSNQSHHSERVVERIYTNAMAALLEREDARHIIRQREAYRLLLDLGHLLAWSSEQLQHAVNKMQ